jgi:hypothetical protein
MHLPLYKCNFLATFACINNMPNMIEIENFTNNSYTERGAYQLQADYSHICNSKEYLYNEKDKAEVVAISVITAYKYPMRAGNEEKVHPVTFDFATTPMKKISAEQFMKLNGIPFDCNKYMN